MYSGASATQVSTEEMGGEEADEGGDERVGQAVEFRVDPGRER
jgi:hypothetical protein